MACGWPRARAQRACAAPSSAAVLGFSPSSLTSRRRARADVAVVPASPATEGGGASHVTRPLPATRRRFERARRRRVRGADQRRIARRWRHRRQCPHPHRARADVAIVPAAPAAGGGGGRRAVSHALDVDSEPPPTRARRPCRGARACLNSSARAPPREINVRSGADGAGLSTRSPQRPPAHPHHPPTVHWHGR